MGNDKIAEPEQRDYQWLFDRIRTIIGDVVDPLKDDMREMKELQKETRDKLNSKVETIVRNEERVMSLENKSKEEKKDNKSHWTIGLSIISIIIALGTAGIGLIIALKGGFSG